MLRESEIEFLKTKAYDLDFMYNYLDKCWFSIKYAAETCRENEEYCEKAVSLNRSAIFYISENLLNDRDFMKRLIAKDEETARYIGDVLKEDISFLKELLEEKLIKINQWKGDLTEELVLENIYDVSIYQLDEEFLSNKEILLKVLEAHSLNSSKIIKKLVENDFYGFTDDRDIMRIALNTMTFEAEYQFENDDIYNLLSDELKNDKSFIIETARGSSNILKYLTEKQKNDKELFMELVKINGDNLDYASDELREDTDLIIEAIRYSKYFSSWSFLPEYFDDEEILNEINDKKLRIVKDMNSLNIQMFLNNEVIILPVKIVKSEYLEVDLNKFNLEVEFKIENKEESYTARFQNDYCAYALDEDEDNHMILISEKLKEKKSNNEIVQLVLAKTILDEEYSLLGFWEKL